MSSFNIINKLLKELIDAIKAKHDQTHVYKEPQVINLDDASFPLLKSN
jgi:hypothetical protein